MPDPATALKEARAALGRAERIVVLTGAGISAESGVPTFRDRGGLWARYDPEELATPGGFAKDPSKVWEWYDLRREAVLACSPNPGHRAVARLLAGRAGSTLVTQNVDGLHHRALEDEGVSPDAEAWQRILELHGNLLRTRCSGCPRSAWDPRPVRAATPADLPRCEGCGELLRPAVIWFGELLDARTLETAFRRAGEADVCLVVGTSAVVHPAASVPLATLEGGGSLIEVNPEPTPLTRLSRWSLRGPAGSLLPSLLPGPPSGS